MKVDDEYTYFLFEEFDSPALLPNDTGCEIYFKNGKPFLTDSGKTNMDKSFVQLLDTARAKVQEYNDKTGRNLVFVVNSGYRTPQYNGTLENSVPNSAHTKGLAVDISTRNWSDTEKQMVIDIFKNLGITRFGIGQNFMHIDNDKTKPQNATWYY